VKKQRFEFGHGASLVAGKRVKSPISLISKDLKVRSCHGRWRLRVFPFAGSLRPMPGWGYFFRKNPVFLPPRVGWTSPKKSNIKKCFYT
jgi:hypothetical protein